jgi:hypothetical protein
MKYRLHRFLFLICVCLIHYGITQAADTCVSYDRKLYKHWIDEDKDCQNTRQEVLIAESAGEVSYKSDRSCSLVSGIWNDPYSGNTYTSASDLDIDHLVPLKEVHESGGWAWSAGQRMAYANDLSDEMTLIAVDKRLNRQKGAKDPAEWMPPNRAYWQEYAKQWIAIKVRWGLTADPREMVVLREILGTDHQMPVEAPESECGDLAEAGSSPAVPVAVEVICGTKRYCKEMTSCEEARGYLAQCGLKGLDRNKDGVPCESLCK